MALRIALNNSEMASLGRLSQFVVNLCEQRFFYHGAAAAVPKVSADLESDPGRRSSQAAKTKITSMMDEREMSARRTSFPEMCEETHRKMFPYNLEMSSRYRDVKDMDTMENYKRWKMSEAQRCRSDLQPKNLTGGCASMHLDEAYRATTRTLLGSNKPRNSRNFSSISVAMTTNVLSMGGCRQMSTCLSNRSKFGATPSKTIGQVRFTGHGTTKAILEEWNKRAAQDFLRIDNILYKYKREELQIKGGEKCPSGKGGGGHHEKKKASALGGELGNDAMVTNLISGNRALKPPQQIRFYSTAPKPIGLKRLPKPLADASTFEVLHKPPVTRFAERADDNLDLHQLKPLPAFVPKKLPKNEEEVADDSVPISQ